MQQDRPIILVQPKSTLNMGSRAIPLGLLLAAIHVHKTHNVQIVDQSIEPSWKKRLISLLGDNPICLGVTSMTGQQIRYALEAAALAREHGCPVVWGGIHPSLMPEQTVAHPLADYVVAGEGEETFRDLVEALERGTPARDIPGVWSKEGGQVRFGGQRPFVDLESLPDIPYHLLDLNRYTRRGKFGSALTLYTSHGCPRHCRFCYNTGYHHSQWRPISAEKNIADIKRVRAACPSIEHIAIWDDAFFPDLNRCKAIAAGIAGLDPRPTWSVFGTHVRDIVRMDDAYLDFLKGTGLTDVLLGVEVTTPGLISSLRKNFTIEQLLESNRRLRAHGIRPTYTFMSGLPGETDDDIRSTVEVMFKLKQQNPDAILGNIKPFLPYPGTELYEEALSRGFQPPKQLDHWSRFVWGNYVNIDIPWVSKQRQRWLNTLYFYTVALNPEYLFIDSSLFSFLARIILPITTWRVERLWFRFPLAARVMALAERFLL